MRFCGNKSWIYYRGVRIYKEEWYGVWVKRDIATNQMVSSAQFQSENGFQNEFARSTNVHLHLFVQIVTNFLYSIYFFFFFKFFNHFIYFWYLNFSFELKDYKIITDKHSEFDIKLNWSKIPIAIA